mgnify:CR=1 FL=1
MMLDQIDCLIIMHVRGNNHCQYNHHCLTTNTSNIYPSNLGMGMNSVLTLASSVDAFTPEEDGAIMRAESTDGLIIVCIKGNVNWDKEPS